jgi:hypothetical protein
MSAKSEEVDDVHDEVCASCGTAAIDDVTLKDCDGGCELVKYCSDKCQGNNREQHEQECKKRTAEIRDKDLFTQPDSSHLGECPLCCLPLPIDMTESGLAGCCCKIICNGCFFSNQLREVEGGLEHRCAFCREPVLNSDERDELNKRLMERVKKDDPVAMNEMGRIHEREGDYGKALEYWTMAAELGYVNAHYYLGFLYLNGDGVEKDEKKAVYHWEQAAIGGHPQARCLLADYEMENGRSERAAKHYIINANLGCDKSVKLIKDLFVQGIVSKEEYAAALRGYQSAANETKSAERARAAIYFNIEKEIDGTTSSAELNEMIMKQKEQSGYWR